MNSPGSNPAENRNEVIAKTLAILSPEIAKIDPAVKKNLAPFFRDLEVRVLALLDGTNDDMRIPFAAQIQEFSGHMFSPHFLLRVKINPQTHEKQLVITREDKSYDEQRREGLRDYAMGGGGSMIGTTELATLDLG